MSVRVVGPWRAAQTAKQPQAQGPDDAVALLNCYARDTDTGPVVSGVPGFSLMGAQLGTGATRLVQRMVQFTTRAGTEYTVAIVDGLFYTYNWSTNAWTEVVTTANLTTAGITLSTTARVYCVTFADTLVVSDGVNVPWTWDGTSGAGGLTLLSNAPVLYGQPVVYYAKLFGIKNTARQTIVWSEEGDPATGYEAGGYNNAWDLVQTATEGLVALAATNDALFYLRANSTGAVTGAVTTDFQSTGTLEAVSSTFGTVSPAAVVVAGNAVWHVDQFGGLRRATQGASEEVALGAHERRRSVSRSSLNLWLATVDPETGHVLFGYPDTGSTLNSVFRVDLASGRLAGEEGGYQFTALDRVKNAAGTPVVVHGGGSSATASTEGYTYAHGTPDGSTWSRGFQAGSAAVSHEVETEAVLWSPVAESIFTRLDLSLIPRTTWTGAQVRFTTPYRTRTVALPTVSPGGVALGTFVLGTDTLGGAIEERHVGFPFRERGRWCRFRITHGTVGERMELNLLTVAATPVSTKTGVR